VRAKSWKMAKGWRKPIARFLHVQVMGNSQSIENKRVSSGRACKPDSVPRALRKNQSSRSAIIPLGRDSRRDSSGLPEGCSPTTQLLAPPRRKRFPLSRITLGEPGRLSPPIWPCTTRGFPCLRCCHRSGGLLPHLFTLTKRNQRFEDVSQVYLRDVTVLLRRRSIFCGTFRERSG
jgi:hypothetical protein